MSIAEDEAKERFKGMYQDDMREVYVLGRTAPPAAAEIEAVAKRLLWRSCRKWDGIESDCAAKDEDDAWDYAGKSVAIGKTSSIGRRKYSKWNDMR